MMLMLLLHDYTHTLTTILTQLLTLLTRLIHTLTLFRKSIPSLTCTIYGGLHLKCGMYTTYNTIQSLTILTIQMLTR